MAPDDDEIDEELKKLLEQIAKIPPRPAPKWSPPPPQPPKPKTNDPQSRRAAWRTI